MPKWLLCGVEGAGFDHSCSSKPDKFILHGLEGQPIVSNNYGLWYTYNLYNLQLYLMDWRWEQHDTGISWHFSIYMRYRKDKNNMKNLSLCLVEVVTKDGKKPLQCFWPSNFQKQSLAPRKSRKNLSALSHHSHRFISALEHSWAFLSSRL
jgi:hypothetical protein